jgi:hypothetical protein
MNTDQEESAKTKVTKYSHWALVILISAFALASAYISFVLMIGSGFIFGDIDYTEAQMEAANRKAAVLKLVALIGLCVSILVICRSGRIARFILRALGVTNLEREWHPTDFR